MFNGSKRQELIVVAKKVSNKIEKNLFNITLDILSCEKKYGISYKEYLKNEIYLLTDLQRECYISDKQNNTWIEKYNNKNYESFFTDTNKFYTTFQHFINRDYFIIDGKNYNKFVEYLIGKSKIVAKPKRKNSKQKPAIIRINAKTDRRKLYDTLLKNKTIILEEFIRQTKELNNISESAVNSIIFTTFIDDKGKMNILNRIFKIGILNSRLETDWLYTILDSSGKVLYKPISLFNEKTNCSKIKINIDNYVFNDLKKLEEFVTYIAGEFKEVRYVSWNVTFTDKGPTLLSADFNPIVFNIKPSINSDFIGLKKEYKKIIGGEL